MNIEANPEFILLASSHETDHLKVQRKSNTFSIVTYKKPTLYVNKNNVDPFGYFRSVVIDHNCNNKIVCVSPSKSIPENLVTNKYRAEELVEGTMINVFFDETSEQWLLATKGNIGATNRFYVGSRSFSDLFFDAADLCQFDIETLQKGFSYSFVLQHPENDFVRELKRPLLYLVDVFDVTNGTVKYVSNYRTRQLVPKSVRYPKLLKEKDVKFLKSNKAPFDIMGYVMKDPETGLRYKWRNPNYEYAHSLRGNQPNNAILYRSLCQKKGLKEFLRYFPRYQSLFNYYRIVLSNMQKLVLHNYSECFISKTKTLQYFQQPMKNILYQIHKIYLEQLKPNRLFVTLDDVRLFFDTMQDQTFHQIFNNRHQDLEPVNVNSPIWP